MASTERDKQALIPVIPTEFSVTQVKTLGRSLVSLTAPLRDSAVEIAEDLTAVEISKKMLTMARSMIRLHLDPSPYLQTAFDLIPNFELGSSARKPTDTALILKDQCSVILDVADMQTEANLDVSSTLAFADVYLMKLHKSKHYPDARTSFIRRKAVIEAKANRLPQALETAASIGGDSVNLRNQAFEEIGLVLLEQAKFNQATHVLEENLVGNHFRMEAFRKAAVVLHQKRSSVKAQDESTDTDLKERSAYFIGKAVETAAIADQKPLDKRVKTLLKIAETEIACGFSPDQTTKTALDFLNNADYSQSGNTTAAVAAFFEISDFQRSKGLITEACETLENGYRLVRGETFNIRANEQAFAQYLWDMTERLIAMGRIDNIEDIRRIYYPDDGLTMTILRDSHSKDSYDRPLDSPRPITIDDIVSFGPYHHNHAPYTYNFRGWVKKWSEIAAKKQLDTSDSEKPEVRLTGENSFPDFIKELELRVPFAEKIQLTVNTDHGPYFQGPINDLFCRLYRKEADNPLGEATIALEKIKARGSIDSCETHRKVCEFLEVTRFLIKEQLDPEIAIHYAEEEISATEADIIDYIRLNNIDVHKNQDHLFPAEIHQFGRVFAGKQEIELACQEMAVYLAMHGQKDRAITYLVKTKNAIRELACKHLTLYYACKGQIEDALDLLMFAQGAETVTTGVRAIGLSLINQGKPAGISLSTMDLHFGTSIAESTKPKLVDPLKVIMTETAKTSDDATNYAERLVRLLNIWFDTAGGIQADTITQEYADAAKAVKNTAINPQVFLAPLNEKLKIRKETEGLRGFWCEKMKAWSQMSSESGLALAQARAGQLEEALSTLDQIDSSTDRNKAVTEILAALLIEGKTDQLPQYLTKIKGGIGKLSALAAVLETAEKHVYGSLPIANQQLIEGKTTEQRSVDNYKD